MATTIIAATLSAIVAGLVVYVLAHRHARRELSGLSAKLADLDKAALASAASANSIQEELRVRLNEARDRETEANRKAAEAERRRDQISEELKFAIEGRGRAESEAGRVEELRNAVAARDTQIEGLHDRVANLSREHAIAVSDAEGEREKASELVAAERRTHEAVVKAKDDQIEQLNVFIASAHDVLTREFKELSGDALRATSDQLIRTTAEIIDKHDEKAMDDVKLQRERIEHLLKPVEDTVKSLDRHLEDTNIARSNAEAVLGQEIQRLAGASESLTNALKKPVVRGTWGEMTLENALENAGLQPEIDYILQHYTDAEDGRKRTDAIVNLPKGRKLIIDSKNLMETYLAFAACGNETEKAALSEIHSRALRAHVRALSDKEYWRRYDGLDCVILFIPHDGMYHAAIQDEAELIRDACEKRVFISNPMTLIPLLKAVRFVLDQEKLNKSAEQISRVGTDLYTEITRFAENMMTVGSKIRATVEAYNDAIPGLDRFILAKSRKLKQLGAAKGAEPELPKELEVTPRRFAAPELQSLNNLLFADEPTLDGNEPVEELQTSEVVTTE